MPEGAGAKGSIPAMVRAPRSGTYFSLAKDAWERGPKPVNREDHIDRLPSRDLELRT